MTLCVCRRGRGGPQHGVVQLQLHVQRGDGVPDRDQLQPALRTVQHHRHLLRLLPRSVLLLGFAVALTRVVEMGSFAERTELGYSSLPGNKDQADLDILLQTLCTHLSTLNEPYIGTAPIFIYFYLFIFLRFFFLLVF